MTTASNIKQDPRHKAEPRAKWSRFDDPSRKTEYRAKWSRFRSSLRWLQKKGFFCLRFDRTFRVPWVFFAVKRTRVCIVLSRRMAWVNDEDVKKLEKFSSIHLDRLVMRWDEHAKKPRLGKINDQGEMEEIYDDEILN